MCWQDMGLHAKIKLWLNVSCERNNLRKPKNQAAGWWLLIFAESDRAATPLHHADSSRDLESLPGHWMGTQSFGRRIKPRILKVPHSHFIRLFATPTIPLPERPETAQ